MIKVWLGSLAAYNAGALVGRWVDLPKTDEELSEIIEAINKEAEEIDGVYLSEEIDIFDFETEVDGIYNDLNRLGLREMNELAERLEGLDEYELKELAALIEGTDSIEEALDIHEQGRAIIIHDIEDNDDLGRAWVEELGGMEVPEHLVNYIDYEAIGRDLCFDGWTITSQGVAVCIN
jgi:antirestriction protein